MTLETRTIAPRALALSGATLLIAASASLGAYYGYTTGAHVSVAIGLIFAGAALGGEMLKPLAVLATLNAIKNWSFGQAGACALLSFVLIAYSFTAELSLSATSRSDSAAQRGHTADIAADARADRTRALAELAALEPSRPAAEAGAVLSKLQSAPRARNCLHELHLSRPARRICNQVFELKAEIARSERRSKLEQALADATQRIENGRGGSVDAYPLATVLSAYFAAVGWTTSPKHLAPWLALIPVLFLEIGSSLALVALRHVVSASPSAPVTPPASKLPDTDRTPEDDTNEPNAGSKVVDLVRAKGGVLSGGQRTIAKLVGVSKSRLNELLHELAKAGLVRLDTGRTGTTVRLVAA